MGLELLNACKVLPMVCSSSAFLRLSSRILRAAADVVPSLSPWSISSWRIHLRSVSGFIPNLLAVARIASYSEA